MTKIKVMVVTTVKTGNQKPVVYNEEEAIEVVSVLNTLELT